MRKAIIISFILVILCIYSNAVLATDTFKWSNGNTTGKICVGTCGSRDGYSNVAYTASSISSANKLFFNDDIYITGILVYTTRVGTSMNSRIGIKTSSSGSPISGDELNYIVYTDTVVTSLTNGGYSNISLTSTKLSKNTLYYIFFGRDSSSVSTSHYYSVGYTVDYSASPNGTFKSYHTTPTTGWTNYGKGADIYYYMKVENKYNTTVRLNIYDEITNLPMKNEVMTSIFYGSKGQIYTKQIYSNITNMFFNITPDNYTIITQGSSDYTSPRSIYKEIKSNNDYTLDLYMANSSSDVSFEVYNSISQNPIQNANINLYRLLSNGSYKLVANGITNSQGKTIIPILYNNGFYKTYLYYNNILLNNPTGSPIIETPMLFYINTWENTNLTDYSLLQYITSGLSYIWNNGTTFNNSYTYNDPNSVISGGCLYVYETNYKTVLLKNSSCSSSTSGTITRNIYTTGGTYKVIGTIIFNGHEYIFKSYIKNLGESRPLETQSDLFLFMFIILTIAMLGFFINPSIGFIAFGLGFIVTSFIGVLTFSISIPISIICIILSYVVAFND